MYIIYTYFKTWIDFLVGIQGHTAKCPCAFCEWLKGTDGKGKERDIDSIK